MRWGWCVTAKRCYWHVHYSLFIIPSSLFTIAWEVFQHLLAQEASVEMRVDLRRAAVLVAQHLLDGA